LSGLLFVGECTERKPTDIKVMLRVGSVINNHAKRLVGFYVGYVICQVVDEI
jgi:hypothetical protein